MPRPAAVPPAGNLCLGRAHHPVPAPRLSVRFDRVMFDDCHLDGRDAGAGDLIAWTEAAPRVGGTGGGMRRTVAWVTKEEGGIFVLEVVYSDGAAAYPVGTTLRRKASALQRHGLRRQARVAERDATIVDLEQLSFEFG